MIQCIAETTFVSGGTRSQKVLILGGGNAFVSTNLGAPALTLGGAGTIPTAGFFSAAGFPGLGDIYVVGPSLMLRVRTGVNALAAWVPTTAAAVPTGCTIAAVYRKRLFLSGKRGDEGNYFASRIEDPGDWDESATDVAGAYTGNTMLAKAADEIRAIIPFNNDALFLIGDRTVNRMSGDLRDGGRMTETAGDAGIFGPDAWCQDNGESVYYAGPGGFFRLNVGGTPENLATGKYLHLFKQLDSDTHQVQVRFDSRNQGVYVFATPLDGSHATHLRFDTRTGGFFPLVFDIGVADRHGPTASLVYAEGDKDAYRVLLGGRDNRVRTPRDWALTDDGTTILSEAYIGPIRPGGPMRDAKSISLDLTLAEQHYSFAAGDCHVSWSLQSGSDPFNAYDAPRGFKSGDCTTWGRQGLFYSRIYGNAFFLKLRNASASKTWRLEQAVLRVQDAGRNRQ